MRKRGACLYRLILRYTGLDELAFFARAAKANVQWLHDLAESLPDD